MGQTSPAESGYPLARQGPLPRSTFALNLVGDGSRIAKRLEVLQRMAVIVPGIAAFNLLHKLAKGIKYLLRIWPPRFAPDCSSGLPF
jgi:hypothetical protein